MSGDGVVFVGLEAVGYSADAERWTFGAEGPAAWALFDAMASEEEATVDGVVAATVEVSNRVSLSRLQADPNVYLVDLSLGYARDLLGSAGTDLVANDLYWYVAGWIAIEEAGG